MNYKFSIARDKSTMNYQVDRFDMKLEFDIDPVSNGHRIMRLMNCPRILMTSMQNRVYAQYALIKKHICSK